MNTIDLIKVDIDTRKIQLPSDFSLGVVNDNSCRKIGFIVSKKSDTTDISDLTFRINTLSARGTPDILECEVNDDNDNFIITSELKGTLFECSGTAVINLCGINGSLKANTKTNHLIEVEIVDSGGSTYGVKANVRGGVEDLSTCQPCYSAFVKADIQEIARVGIYPHDADAPFTFDKFIIYGR